MTEPLIHAGNPARREKLKAVAKAALDLAEWAAQGKDDYYLAAQMGLMVRQFSRVVRRSSHYPDMPAVLDFLGTQIQSVVGKAHKPEGPPAEHAVEPVHETVLQATGEHNGR